MCFPAVVDPTAYELVGKQPVLYLPPPPEHPPPSDIGSPPDSPGTDPRYPGRRLPHSDCEPSSPGQRRRAHRPVPANRYATSGPPKGSRGGAAGRHGRPPPAAAPRFRYVEDLPPPSWNEADCRYDWPICLLVCFCLQCFDAVGWAAGRASGLQNTELWGAGVVICLERGADLHMAQLMPLPLTVSCFSKIQIGFNFWYRLTWLVLYKGPLNVFVVVFYTRTRLTALCPGVD